MAFKEVNISDDIYKPVDIEIRQQDMRVRAKSSSHSHLTRHHSKNIKSLHFQQPPPNPVLVASK